MPPKLTATTVLLVLSTPQAQVSAQNALPAVQRAPTLRAAACAQTTSSSSAASALVMVPWTQQVNAYRVHQTNSTEQESANRALEIVLLVQLVPVLVLLAAPHSR